jgi:hypothetical protein
MELDVLQYDYGGYMPWTKKYQFVVAIVIQHCELRRKNRWAFT